MRGTNVQVTLDELIDEVDEFRRQQKNPPTRPAAIRELIRCGLREIEHSIDAKRERHDVRQRSRNRATAEKCGSTLAEARS
jgi:metal-responsive CopG/Arc/MetJ family transcriptional regulator